jgi:ACT domain-containing protein
LMLNCLLLKHHRTKLKMPNQELLYKISSDIFAELGENFDEAKAENLVTRIYRTVEPFIANANDSGKNSSENRIVVSVFGKDHAGIVAKVTEILAETSCSIIDINQTLVGGKFAMVIVANTTDASETVASLKEKFRTAGDALGVRIYVQREDLFNAMHRI